MTVPIAEILATMPSGARGQTLSADQLGQYLRDHYRTDAEKTREARHRLRDELFLDGGTAAMEALLNTLFDDMTVREKRKKWIKWARFNNPIKRIVTEDSTIYSERAIRSVAGEENNAKYREVQELCRQDEQFIRVNRLLNLHRWLLVGFRVRELPGGEREPVIDIATPSIVRAVVHPNDATLPVGWLIRVAHRNFHTSDTDKAPMWTLETDHETVWLTEDFRPLREMEHGFPRSRWVPITRGPIAPGFYPGEEGEDLVAGHFAIWFSNICMLKETKSATNQTILTGDLSSMARAQASDTEAPIEAPEGVGVSTVDMSMDVSMFAQAADHILERLGNNYGLSGPLLKHQGVQSAEARELMLVPVKERRREQQVPFRTFERRFVAVQSMVLHRDLPALAFDVDGWTLDFGESQTPLSHAEELTIFEKERSMGVASTLTYLMQKNPDLTLEMATAYVQQCIRDETWRVREMRELQAMSGAMSELVAESFAAVAPAATPQAEAPIKEEMAS